MKKNVSTQEAHIRTLIGIILLLIALFLIDNAVGKILFATIAAILAGTAFLHTCPLYSLMDKYEKKVPDVSSPETTSPTPTPEKTVVGMEEENTDTEPVVEEETAEEKKV